MTTPPHLLRPVSPFDFAQTLAFVSGFTPTSDEQKLEAQSLAKAVRIHRQTVGFDLHSVGTLDAPELRCYLFGNAPLNSEIKEAALKRVRFFLSLDEDLGPFYALAQQDVPFQRVLRQLYGYHQVKFLTPFENACWAVLTQRTPGDTARGMKRRLVDTYGGSVQIGNSVLWAFPEPADLAGASVAELRTLLKHPRKGESLAAVVQAFGQVEEEWLRQGPLSEVRAWLRGIYGFGEWSANFVLLRGLGRMEGAVLDDPDSVFTRELMNAAAKVYGPMSFEALSAHAHRYVVCQGYWAHYLRVAA
ncbi:DNA-3-methyladenine glycosylase 2 family protein [Deinococcus sp. Arct2-2]|uniref:DNA-3-methyladenine glycosylase family protein n=1 Tax=Deinococcus sp. Arct2-2 TaxID=2568653 RepID=UPI0010A2C4E1|nr:DNA-3-methyladenine glycosylase [Deinococcus sp. Arct2-2]THF66694.1 DNA-3-methyladenine glycosylase 2 family protein [Deinococcus sp. Arct2-2]